MKDRVIEILQPIELQYAQANEEACCAQPTDGSDCCDKSVEATASGECCAQPVDSSSCC